MNKLKMLSDDSKWDFLRKYFAKAKTEFNICFIEFRLDLNPENFQPAIYAYLDDLKRNLKDLDKELLLGIKNDPILEWISAAALKRAAREANPNQDIPDGSPTRDMTTTLTSTIAMAGVNKDVLKADLNQSSTSLKKKGTKSPVKKDMDKSFDRKANVDKITKRVEFVFLPTYQVMRKIILKALKAASKK
jgi:hypothetical protein